MLVKYISTLSRHERTGEDLGQLADGAEDLSNETVRAAERRVDLRADTYEAAGHGKLQVVRLCVERDDARVDGLAAIAPRAVLRDDPGPDLDLHP